MKNPYKQSNSMMAFNNWGTLNDNHLGIYLLVIIIRELIFIVVTQRPVRILQIIVVKYYT